MVLPHNILLQSKASYEEMVKPNRRQLLEVLKEIEAFLVAEKESGIKEYHLRRPKITNPKSLLDELKKKTLRCRGCDLNKSKTNLVFGEGNARAELVFVGEAPGREEDLEGAPFVGMAGQLLTKIIESIGLRRNDVYITNVLKCRPLGNRDPIASEIASCGLWLSEQLEIIKPKVICALGKFAAQTLLDTDEPITAMRGKFHNYRSAKLIPTFHPAYLLRNPSGKKAVWEDMKKIREELKSNP